MPAPTALYRIGNCHRCRFQSGQIWDLKQAVEVMGTAQLGGELTDDEVASIAEFLRSLIGEPPKVDYG
jgi:cytochrome c peroxidase